MPYLCSALTVSALFLASLPCSAQLLNQGGTFLSDELKGIGARGPVKRVEQIATGKYTPGGGFRHLSFVKEFDRHGRLVLEKWKTKKGDRFEEVKTVQIVRAADRVVSEQVGEQHRGRKTITFRYDPEGKLLEKRDLCVSPPRCRTVVTAWKYDQQGRKVEERYTRPEEKNLPGFPYSFLFTYDRKGQLVGKSLERRERKELVETYRYDAAGKRVEQIDWMPGERIERKTIFAYSGDGTRSRTESVRYWDRSNGPDSPGRPVPLPSGEASVKGLEEQRGVSIYDRFGEISEAKSLVAGKVVERNTFERNERGDVIRMVIHVHGSRYENVYTYDERGNWIRKVCTLNGKPHHVFERKLEYR